jgi:CRISPR-associated exonuclease Cas4
VNAASAIDRDPEGDDLVPLSALNALLYCERRAALRHLDALFVHNEHTRAGDILHRRADRPGVERRGRDQDQGSQQNASPDENQPAEKPRKARGRVRTERGLWIVSRRLLLYGRADLVEFRPAARRGSCPPVPYPVEYKHGARKNWDNDEIQLCAQALCLEEMLGREVPAGAIYHSKSRGRREIPFTPDLRDRTEATVTRLHDLLASRQIPPAIRGPRCRGCSLKDHCLPDIFGRPARIVSLTRLLFQSDLSDPNPAGA